MPVLGSIKQTASAVTNFGINLVKYLFGRPSYSQSEDDSSIPKQQSTDILGMIYELMIKVRLEELENRSLKEISEKREEQLKNDRNDELVRAIRGIKIPKPVPTTERESAPTTPLFIPGRSKKPSATTEKSKTEKPSTTKVPKPGGGGKVGAAVGIVGVGVATMQSLKAKVSGRESAGTTDKSYDIMNIVKGDKNKSFLVQPGNLDVTTNQPYNKKLSEMTMGEVVELAERRGKFFNKSGAGKAAGKYQFMPATLATVASKTFGPNWKSELFSPDNQEKLMDSLILDNAALLKEAGLPVSDASLYMMHFLGSVKKVAQMLNGPDDVLMKQVLGPAGAQANPRIAEMTVGQYKDSLRVESPGKAAFTFEPINVGDLIEKSTKENISGKSELVEREKSINVNNNIIGFEEGSSGSTSESPIFNDRPAWQRK